MMDGSTVHYINHGPVDCNTVFTHEDLKGKTAIVTGGSKGLGAHYVRALAHAGATVYIGDVDVEAGMQLAQELRPLVHFTKCDVTCWDHQVGLFKAALTGSDDGNIAIVIANAGISGQDPVFNDDEDAEGGPKEPDLKILSVNLKGVLYTTKLALYHFRQQHKSAGSEKHDSDTCLILQGSIAGYVDQPGSPQYNASKFGIRGLMRCLRETTLQHKTRVNYIAPWYIKTDILSEAVAQRITSKGVVFAEAADAATAVMRIVSDKTIHGRSIAIVPRIWASQGFVDLKQDDYDPGEALHGWQELVLRTSHRLQGPSVLA